MNILMIDDRVPHLDSGAGYPRANALIHALLPACKRMAFYPLVFPNEPEEGRYRDIDPRVEFVLGRGKPGLAQSLREFADLGFTVLWVSRPENMFVVDNLLRASPDLRAHFTLVYDAEALYALRTKDMRRLQNDPLGATDEARMLAGEVNLAARADIVVSVSAAEAAAFAAAREGLACKILGFTSVPEPTPAPFEQRHNFGFVGAIRRMSPNEDSLLWYAANVMHRLSRRTGAALHVAGDVESPQVLSYAGPKFIVLGKVADLPAFFNSIRVFIAPTRYAAGLPQKLIDAASAGVPIVGTSLLAGELGWRNRREMLIADTPDAFLAACSELYEAPKLWEELRANALSAVGSRFGPGPFAAEAAEIVAAIAAYGSSASL